MRNKLFCVVNIVIGFVAGIVVGYVTITAYNNQQAKALFYLAGQYYEQTIIIMLLILQFSRSQKTQRNMVRYTYWEIFIIDRVIINLQNKCIKWLLTKSIITRFTKMDI